MLYLGDNPDLKKIQNPDLHNGKMKMYVETAIIHKIFKHLVIVRKMFLWKLQSTRCDSNTLAVSRRTLDPVKSRRGRNAAVFQTSILRSATDPM